MKRKIFLIMTTLFLLIGLTSCSGEEKPSPNPDPKPPVTEPTPDPEPIKPVDEFVVKTECAAGKFVSNEYVMSVINTNEEYFSFDNEALEISINRDNWASVTAVNTNETKVVSKNVNVVPNDAIEVKFVTSLHSNDDNTIKGVELIVDRTKIKVGETLVKIHLKPSNGSTSADELDLCVPLKVVEFGSISVPTKEIKFNVDLTGVDEALLTKGIEFVAFDQYHKYGASNPSFTLTKLSKLTETITLSVPLNKELNINIRYFEGDRPKGLKFEVKDDLSFTMKGSYYVFNSVPSKPIEVTFVK